MKAFRVTWSEEYLQEIRKGNWTLSREDIKQILTNQTIIDNMLKHLGAHESQLVEQGIEFEH